MLWRLKFFSILRNVVLSVLNLNYVSSIQCFVAFVFANSKQRLRTDVRLLSKFQFQFFLGFSEHGFSNDFSNLIKAVWLHLQFATVQNLTTQTQNDDIYSGFINYNRQILLNIYCALIELCSLCFFRNKLNQSATGEQITPCNSTNNCQKLIKHWI